MPLTLQRLLFALAGAVILVDAAWWSLGDFQVDLVAYGRLAAMALALLAGGVYYQRRRREPALAAMLMGASFLVLFSAGASVLNYFLLTVAGPRIDTALVAADRAMGFDWYAVMVAMADHPLLNAVFFRVYNMVLPEIALVLVLLAWMGRPEQVYRYCLALGAGALIAIGIWTLMPSLGAKSLYTLPPDVARRLTLSVTCEYGQALVALLHNGPGFITPADLRGLIAFPSYHGVLALIVAWYGWQIPWLRWPLLLLNAVVIACSPIQGGHHMVDMLGSFPVAALALWMVRKRTSAKSSEKTRGLVNETPNSAPMPAYRGFFRIDTAQDESRDAVAIKPTLSGIP